MELKLLPEDIDKFIKEAVLRSALGKNIEQVIDKAVKDSIDRYDSPIKQLVNEIIKEIVKDHLTKEENKSLIYEALLKNITPDAIETMVRYGIDQLKRQIDN